MSNALATQGTTLHAEFTLSGLSLTASSGTLTRATGSFAADGMLVGMKFTTTLTDNTGVTFTVTAVGTTTLTVTPNLTTVASPTSAALNVIVPIEEMTDFDGPGGSNSEIDVTSLDSTSREFRNGLRDSGEVQIEMNFVPNAPGHIYLRRRQAVTNVPTAFVLTLTDSPATTASFDAFVREFKINGAVDDKVSASCTLRVTGDVTWSDMA
jgi:hypothetical protein